MDSLFPRDSIGSSFPQDLSVEWTEEMDVGIAEILRYVKKRPIRNAAPGPDNLKAAVWKKASCSYILPTC